MKAYVTDDTLLVTQNNKMQKPWQFGRIVLKLDHSAACDGPEPKQVDAFDREPKHVHYLVVTTVTDEAARLQRQRKKLKS